MPQQVRHFVGWATVVAFAVLAQPSLGAVEPDFNRDVRPILAARCFKCHGPDEGSRKGDLRLDSRDAAAATLGKAGDSEFLKRIVSTEASEVMPPPSTKVTLTAKEKETLQAWIAAGAKYEAHWAFASPKRTAVPEVGAKHPIDAFITARLQKEKLSLSPEADRATLVRRVFLDLIGVPPTPEEAQEFVNDSRPDAYERLVDRLLASPRYGERWARKWLDLARYADTNGYEKDRQRSIWPYRDWVIRALNDDMPFDQFTIEQLAGDLLPNATQSQRIATGFHRNTMLNEEGGIDPQEFRYHAVADRTAVTGTVWLGLTVACAQCHTHKFDPITHTEYFRLFSFLNNADEPDLAVTTPESAKRRAEIQAKIDALTVGLADKLDGKKRTALFEAWAASERKAAVKWQILKPTSLEAGPSRLQLQPDGSIFASGDAQKRDVYTLALELPAGVTAFRIEAIPDERLPKGGPGRAFYEGPKGDFLLSEFTLKVEGQPAKFASSSETHTRQNLTAKMALDGNPHSGWAGSGQPGVGATAVFNLDKPLAAGKATLELLCERHYPASLGRFRIAFTTTAGAAQARNITAEVEDLLTRADADLQPAEHERLFRAWLAVAPELKAAREEIETLRKQLPSDPTTLVLQERPSDFPRATFRHHRGEFLQAKDEVKPGVPGVLPPLPNEAPANRLALARWLVSSGNPLTARVTVNRHWHAFFGRGLVRTVDDFGYQGEAPSHPELLDWLALEFIEKGWSVKTLHKLIATSSVYRQSSRVTPEQLAKDAENKWLARGPRVRLEAEQVRDSALQAAGVLSTKMYGPSVFPPQPAGVTTEGTYGKLDWKVSTGEDRYRRGLYTFAKRTAPYAMFGTFDGPSGEACIARREVSNTPLQALTMLNDSVSLEAAQGIAKRLTSLDGKTTDRVNQLFQLVLVRKPTAEEAATTAAFFEEQRKKLAADPKRASVLAGTDTDAVDRAAWTATARAILNLDEFVTKE